MQTHMPYTPLRDITFHQNQFILFALTDVHWDYYVVLKFLLSSFLNYLKPEQTLPPRIRHFIIGTPDRRSYVADYNLHFSFCNIRQWQIKTNVNMLHISILSINSSQLGMQFMSLECHVPMTNEISDRKLMQVFWWYGERWLIAQEHMSQVRVIMQCSVHVYACM